MLTSRDMLLQPFQASVKTKGEISLVFIDGVFVHALKKKPSQGDFKVQGGKIEPHQPSQTELNAAMAALEASWMCIHRRHALRDKEAKNKRTKGKKGGDDSGYKRDPFLFGRVDILSNNSGDKLMVSEMEILDPELFFRLSPECVEKFCNAVADKVNQARHC